MQWFSFVCGTAGVMSIAGLEHRGPMSIMGQGFSNW